MFLHNRPLLRLLTFFKARHHRLHYRILLFVVYLHQVQLQVHSRAVATFVSSQASTSINRKTQRSSSNLGREGAHTQGVVKQATVEEEQSKLVYLGRELIQLDPGLNEINGNGFHDLEAEHIQHIDFHFTELVFCEGSICDTGHHVQADAYVLLALDRDVETADREELQFVSLERC